VKAISRFLPLKATPHFPTALPHLRQRLPRLPQETPAPRSVAGPDPLRRPSVVANFRVPASASETTRGVFGTRGGSCAAAPDAYSPPPDFLTLREAEGYSYDEIAEILRCGRQYGQITPQPGPGGVAGRLSQKNLCGNISIAKTRPKQQEYPMNCDQAKQHLWDYDDPAGPPERRQEIERHLAGCAECSGSWRMDHSFGDTPFRSSILKPRFPMDARSS